MGGETKKNGKGISWGYNGYRVDFCSQMPWMQPVVSENSRIHYHNNNTYIIWANYNNSLT